MVEGISYADARQAAADIRSAADAIKEMLEDTTTNMKNIGSDDYWASTAADKVSMKYNELASTYEGIYNKYINIANYIDSVVAAQEAYDNRKAQEADNLAEVA